MEYVGTCINKTNAPKDWREQLERILAALDKEEIKHNDIKHTEVLIKNSKLHLIDFGWMSRGDDWSCGQGFNKRTKPCHRFHDHTAMARITKHLT
jgi:tRNA A-37 threonylcarbamoyl transferase component Bud32